MTNIDKINKKIKLLEQQLLIIKMNINSTYGAGYGKSNILQTYYLTDDIRKQIKQLEKTKIRLFKLNNIINE
jgi:hypothetical protein